MDDFLFFFKSREEALRGRDQIQRTLDYLGLKRNPKKGDWEPTQQCRHLGLLVDTAKGLFVVPPDKEAKICKMAKGVRVQALKNRRLLPARLVAQFTGLCQSVYLACPPARLYLRALHDCLKTRSSWAGNVRLSRQALRDLQWWAELPKEHNGRTIWRSPDQAILHSDASLFAWGGVLNNQCLAHGIWTHAERKHHITFLELLAVLRNVQAYLPRLKSKRCLLYEDNMAVVYIIREKTSRNPVIMACLRELWACLDLNQIDMRVEYVRSAQNPADAPSRLTGAAHWRLRPSIVKTLELRRGAFTVDRFASAHNAHCHRYNSEFADPGSEAVNAMTQDWRGDHNFIHPPPDRELLNAVAQKLREQPTRATVVVPYWTSELWFRELRELSAEMEVVPDAASQACPEFLRHWELRPPRAWSLVYFHLVP